MKDTILNNFLLGFFGSNINVGFYVCSGDFITILKGLDSWKNLGISNLDFWFTTLRTFHCFCINVNSCHYCKVKKCNYLAL